MPRATSLPDVSAITPMLCSLISEPIDTADWLYEPKLDGLRVLCNCNGKQIDLISRNHLSQNFQFPDILKALASAVKSKAILDGEIICLDENGQSSFRALQQRFHLTRSDEVNVRMKAHPAYLYVFDALSISGKNITALPLIERKKLLKKAVKWSDRIRYTPGTPRLGSQLLKEACTRHEEGIVGKRLTSPYLFSRSGDWVKIKCSGRQEFVIGGFTQPQRTRVGLGAILVGYYDEQKNFIYAGKVGTGFTNPVLADLRQQLDKLETKQNPFHGNTKPRIGKARWVKPKLVAEVAFAEWTQNNLLRQPRFEGLRTDKNPTTIRREKAFSNNLILKNVTKRNKT